MAINKQVKILDDKVKQNQADYDLYRQIAKIIALSNGKLDKYEYLTGEDLGYKPDVIQKAKFEYSPLGQVFIKGLDVSKKNEGLLKRLKNIEGKNEQQLDFIRDQGEEQLDLIGKINTDKTKSVEFYGKTNKKLVDLVKRVNKETKENKNKSFLCTNANGTQYDFNKYRNLNQLGSEIYSGELSLEKAKGEQHEMLALINKLKGYNPNNPKKVKSKQEVLHNAEKLYQTRNDVIDAFEGVDKKNVNLKWLHRPNNELKDLIEDIESDIDLKNYSSKKTALSKEFLRRF